MHLFLKNKKIINCSTRNNFIEKINKKSFEIKLVNYTTSTIFMLIKKKRGWKYE